MISKKDKEILRRALDDFFKLADKNFVGDDFRPIFRISLTFLACGYDDVETSLSHTYSTDMILMRKDSDERNQIKDPA